MHYLKAFLTLLSGSKLGFKPLLICFMFFFSPFSLGQILEFDTPSNLLANENSRLRAMIEAEDGKLSHSEDN